jgi:hypothetical protein
MNQINVLSASLLLLVSLFRAGKESTVVPTNCVQSRDGSIGCDNKIKNSASNTQAHPYYDPFND